MERVSKRNYYLDIAQTVLERATCLRRVYGAIIVKNDEIISTGYTARRADARTASTSATARASSSRSRAASATNSAAASTPRRTPSSPPSGATWSARRSI